MPVPLARDPSRRRNDMQHHYRGILIAAIGMALTGCVAKSKYLKKSQAADQLAAQKAVLEGDKTSLTQQLSASEQDKKSLQANLDASKAENQKLLSSLEA